MPRRVSSTPQTPATVRARLTSGGRLAGVPVVGGVGVASLTPPLRRNNQGHATTTLAIHECYQLFVSLPLIHSLLVGEDS